ncbi:MAG: endonuclease NucS domain-containing protein [Vicinamibacterales bacterium]
MPVHHSIWRIGQNPTQLQVSRLTSEQQLEEMITRDPRIVSSEWMLIGRQEVTTHGGRIDLLAIAPDGALVLIEIKRDRTPREIVAQALDYASWVEGLTAEQIADIYSRFSPGGSLSDAFRTRFGADLDEDALNQAHQVVLVAAELDPSSERIIKYLSDRGVAINVLFFQVFQNGNEQLLSRAWLLDPQETQPDPDRGKERGPKEPWNGEFYVSYGGRPWEAARKYGFISGGGGSWFSRTLGLLKPNDRVWVKIPGTGYVGVGVVTEPMQPAKDFTVTTEQGDRSVLDVVDVGDWVRTFLNDPEKSEYFVRVRWLDTVSEADAFDEVGLFGNQNTVCQPRAAKWRHTVERLKSRFPRWQG